VKDSLERLSGSSGDYFGMLMSGLSEGESQRFNQVMQSALQVKDREDKVNLVIHNTA
jgi:hypothetical protein